VLSLSPTAKVSARIDEYVHALAFAGLSVLALLAFRQTKNAALALASVLIVGLASEAAQFFIPGRSASFEDVAANLTGMAAGLVLGMAIRLVTVRVRRPVKDKP